MNINNKYIEIVHNLVNKLCPNKRTPKYNFHYYIKHIIYMITDLTKWSSLKLLHKTKKDFHYKTIYQIFIKWTKLNIFSLAYDILIERYILSDINSSTIIDLFIDTTSIYNKHGRELVEYGQLKKHKVTR